MYFYIQKAYKKLTVASIFLLSHSILSHAQDSLIHTGKEVVISMDKLNLPFNKNNRDITILTQEDIAKLPVRSLNEALSFISGVDIRQRGVNGTQADISIDGGTFDQLVVLVNGHKMNDPQTGHNMMNIPIPLDAIERIEILKGTAASRFGINGLNGAINIITKKSWNQELSISVQTGSNFQSDTSTQNMYHSYGIQFVESKGKDNWNHLFAVSYDGSNGYRYNSSYQNLKALFVNDFKLSESTRLNMTLGFARNKFDARDFYASPSDKESTEKVETLLAGFKLPIYLSNGANLNSYLTYRMGIDDYIFVKSNPSIYQNKHFSHVIDAGSDYIVSNKFGKHVLGFNARYETINSTNLGNRSRTNWGLFYENHQQFSPTIDARFGAFVNYNSVFGWNIYPQVEFGYTPNSQFRIYANAGKGQRIPTFTDLYYTSPTNLGNDTLMPENAWNMEVGMKMRSNGYQWGAHAFHRWGYDMIDWIRQDTAQAWQVYNFSSIRTFGLRLYALKDFYINELQSIRLSGSYTYLKPQIMNDDDPDKAGYLSQYTINALRHHWIATLTYTYDQFYLSLAHKYLNRYVADENIHPDFNKIYHVFDVKAGWSKDKWNFNLQIQNLNAATYIEAGMVTMPKRWSTLTVQYKM